MSKFEFFRLRLWPTAVLLGLAFAVVRLLWFPGAYFGLAGVGKLFALIVLINVALGPALTTLVYKPGKRGMRFDIMALGAIELVAFAFAMHALYQRQPAWVVFAVDRFEIVTRAEVDRTAIRYERLRTRPGHAPRLVYAEMPDDPGAREQLMDDVLFRGLPDLDRRPEFWRPYPEGIRALKVRATPLSSLVEVDDSRARRLQAWLSHAGGRPADYALLPLRGRTGDAAMIVHADIGYPVDILAVDPWSPASRAPSDAGSPTSEQY